MVGPADICIEVVRGQQSCLQSAESRPPMASPESMARDYGEKFVEYEAGGVGEYWIIDPIREECRFDRLGENKRYASHYPDESGYYQTPNLPNLMLHVPTLLEEELPDIFAITENVKAMLNAE